MTGWINGLHEGFEGSHGRGGKCWEACRRERRVTPMENLEEWPRQRSGAAKPTSRDITSAGLCSPGRRRRRS